MTDDELIERNDILCRLGINQLSATACGLDGYQPDGSEIVYDNLPDAVTHVIKACEKEHARLLARDDFNRNRYEDMHRYEMRLETEQTEIVHQVFRLMKALDSAICIIRNDALSPRLDVVEQNWRLRWVSELVNEAGCSEADLSQTRTPATSARIKELASTDEVQAAVNRTPYRSA